MRFPGKCSRPDQLAPTASSLPSECGADGRLAGIGCRVPSREEGEAASRSPISHRLFQQKEKAVGSQILGCFLLRSSLPSPPCFQAYPTSLQTKILGAHGSFQQSKMWPLCGGCVNKCGALPGSRRAASDVRGVVGTPAVQKLVFPVTPRVRKVQREKEEQCFLSLSWRLVFPP